MADPSLRDPARIAAITAVARTAGFARWVILGLTVGTTSLGNTYQSANAVSNVVFELAAGGLLASVLVPTLVRASQDGPGRVSEIASSLVNGFLLLSIPLVLAGVAAGRPVMRLLLSGVPDAALRERQIELGAWFLRYFLPQIPIYLVGAVLTGVLHAHRRFTWPAAAPLCSSLVVIGTYLAFGALGRSADIAGVTSTQLLVLAVGTTAGVAMLAGSQIPSALRTGVRWRPVLRLHDPAVRTALRAGVWGGGVFAATQLGTVAMLVYANRIPGGVVAFQIAFAFYELPYALISLPVGTSLFPALASRTGDEPGFARLLSQGWRTIGFFAVPAAAGLAVLARPVGHAVFGHRGPTVSIAPGLVADALGALALGLPAYALLAFVQRAFYARHRTRPPVLFASIAALTLAAGGAFAGHGSGALRRLGLAAAAGQWLALAVAVAMLAAAVRSWPAVRDVLATARSGVRAAVMAVSVFGVLQLLDGYGSRVKLPLAVAGGLLVYVLLVAPSEDGDRLCSALRRKR